MFNCSRAAARSCGRRRGRDRQHLEHQRPAGQVRPDELRRGQGRRHRADQVPREGTGPIGRDRQRRRAGNDRDADPRRHAGGGEKEKATAEILLGRRRHRRRTSPTLVAFLCSEHARFITGEVLIRSTAGSTSRKAVARDESSSSISRSNGPDGVATITMNLPPLNVLDNADDGGVQRRCWSRWSPTTVSRRDRDRAPRARRSAPASTWRDHSADKVGDMIRLFHGIFRKLASTDALTIAVVQRGGAGWRMRAGVLLRHRARLREGEVRPAGSAGGRVPAGGRGGLPVCGSAFTRRSNSSRWARRSAPTRRTESAWSTTSTRWTNSSGCGGVRGRNRASCRGRWCVSPRRRRRSVRGGRRSPISTGGRTLSERPHEPVRRARGHRGVHGEAGPGVEPRLRPTETAHGFTED